MAFPPGIVPPATPDAGASSAFRPITENQGNPQLQQSLNTIPLSLDEITEWRARILASEQRVTLREGAWDTLLDEYSAPVADKGTPEDVRANVHFRNVHTKIGQLFVRSPDVILTPQGPALDQMLIPDPMTGIPRAVSAEEAVPVRQAVIKQYMGLDHIDGILLMDECLMDMMSWAGLACVEVAYESTSRPTTQPVKDVMGRPVLDLHTQQPMTQQIQVPIHQDVKAKRFSPKKLLLDELLTSARIKEESRWIGRRFFESKRLLKRKYGLSDADVDGGSQEDDRVHPHSDEDHASTAKDQLGGHVIWYKAAYFSDNDHPEAIYQLVLLDCVKDRTVVSRPSLDQTFDPQGALTYDSLKGFPIFVGALRVFPDSPFPQADSAFTNPLAKNLNTHLQQGVKLRDSAIGKQFYDTGAIDEHDIERLKYGPVGEMIGLKESALMHGQDKIFANTAQVHRSPDDYRTAQELQQRMDETLGISSVQAGGQPDTVRSATEINSQSAGSAGRQRKEQDRVVAFYLSIVCAVDTLIFRYFTGNRYVAIVGDDGAAKLAMWNKKLGAGYYSYDIKPDSQLSHDIARNRQQNLAAYTTMAPDPLTNRAPILREIARDHGWDPTRVVHPPEVIAAQQAAASMGAPGPNPPYAGGASGGKGPDGGGNLGPAHARERSGGLQNAQGSANPGDNRQDRQP